MSGDAPPLVVDALGLLCPLPIVRCRQALARVPRGTLVELWSDDDEIRQDLPAFCEGSGHVLVSLERATGPGGEGAWRGVVRRG